MTLRQLYVCAVLFTIALVGSIGLLAVAFNIASLPNPYEVPRYWHTHERIADR